MLSNAYKEQRVAVSLKHVDTTTHLFDAMEDVIHVDENLFYRSKVKGKYVLLPDEPNPVHRMKSKRHIPKIMMLATVARPRHDPVTGEFFDGKLGTWAFLPHEPTTYRNMLLEHVLPAIYANFPGAQQGRRIVVQQDNASLHIQPDDAAWRQTVVASGCNVTFRFQPPNSPDMNVLDLAVFHTLQAQNVKVALDELPPEALNAGFLTLQCVMDDCVAAGDVLSPKQKRK
ncbi:Tranposase [Phytophthora megakarya]|uniref:Tranposase n=1 Tax=Phytophthora megakarya TaxID=4795 RepID=A0A225WGY7_9STRA|nr:Tranposase [Phytophthora megakarya]